MGRKALTRAAHRRVQEEPIEAAPAEPATETVPEIPGMKSETWSGIPMWRCTRCGDTTFDRTEATGHACKQPKYLPEGED